MSEMQKLPAITRLEQVRSALIARYSTIASLLHITKPEKSILERDVKARIRPILKYVDSNAHIFMPVQAGFGESDLDFIIDIKGRSLRVETKVAGKLPTNRQVMKIRQLSRSGVPVLMIDQTNLIDVAIVATLIRDNEKICVHSLSQFFTAFDFAELSREAWGIQNNAYL